MESPVIMRVFPQILQVKRVVVTRYQPENVTENYIVTLLDPLSGIFKLELKTGSFRQIDGKWPM